MCRQLFTEADNVSPLTSPYFAVGLRFRQLAFYLGIRERPRDRLRHLGEIVKVASGRDRPTFSSKDARHGAHGQV
jgi:hypothetical protein